MKQNVEEFMKSSFCQNLLLEIMHAERILNHAIDNYAVNMPDCVEGAIREAEQKLRLIQTEADNWHRAKSEEREQ